MTQKILMPALSSSVLGPGQRFVYFARLCRSCQRGICNTSPDDKGSDPFPMVDPGLRSVAEPAEDHLLLASIAAVLCAYGLALEKQLQHFYVLQIALPT